MKPSNLGRKTTTAGGSAVVGSLCGVLIAAFGNAISCSVTGVVTTIFLACAIGAWAGRVPSVLLGSIGGVLLVGFGSVSGGSALGVVLTIIACAVLAGLSQWFQVRNAWQEPPNEDDFRPPWKRAKEGTLIDGQEKELVL